MRTRCLSVFICSALSAASFQAGSSRLDIESGGWARALAISDSKNTVVIVTTNLGALTRSITDPAAAELANAYGLDRSQVLFHASHPGPGEIADHPAVIHALASAAAAALGKLAPAQLVYGAGRLRAGDAVLDLTGCLGDAISLAPVGPEANCGGPSSQALMRIDGPIRTAFEVTQLDFSPQSNDTFGRRLPFPVQAIRIGSYLTIVALGGEVSLDYAVRAQREFPGGVILVGSSNDVSERIFSARELNQAMNGPLAADTEDRVFAEIGRVLARVGYKLH